MGTSVFQVHDQSTARMRFVTVASEYRKKGLGRRMIKEFEAETLRRGFSRVYMTAIIDAVGFYEK